MGATLSQPSELDAFRAVKEEYETLRGGGDLDDAAILLKLKAKWSELLTAGPSTPGDYDAVRSDLVMVMDQEDWDDGSYAPLLIRLAWHSSGTWCAESKNGGSNGATMRFEAEFKDPENAGLDHARAYLEPLKAKHPWLSYADLWILASYVAIEHTGGPHIDFIGGRRDATETECPPNGRLPEAEYGLTEGLDDQGRVNGWEKLAAYMREKIFYRMGIDDKEIVALLCGGHLYGRCHPEHSGYAGPWIEEMTKFSNEYAADLVGDRWIHVTHDSKEVPCEEMRPAPGKQQYISLGPPEKFERVVGAKAEDYPPGTYAMSEGEEWVNARATADPKSALVAQPAEVAEEDGPPNEFTVVQVEQNGAAVRGRLDCGGWVSLVGSGGYPLFQHVPGALKIRAGEYVVTADSAPLFDFPDKQIGEERKGAVVTVSETTFDDGTALGKCSKGWLTIMTPELGVLADRVEKGHLLSEEGVELKEEEPIKQMMLITDMVLLWDPEFKKHTEVYADDETGTEALSRDFGLAFKKLTELGFKEWPDAVPFAGSGGRCPMGY